MLSVSCGKHRSHFPDTGCCVREHPNQVVYELVLKWIMASVSSTGMPSPVIWNPIRWSCSQGISTTHRFIYKYIQRTRFIIQYRYSLIRMHPHPVYIGTWDPRRLVNGNFSSPQNGAGGTKMQLKLSSWCPGTLSCHLFGRFDTPSRKQKVRGFEIVLHQLI